MIDAPRTETRTIDGVPLTPKGDLYLPKPETFDTVEDERDSPQGQARRRAAHLRQVRVRRRRRRPHHRARPRVPRPVLGQPVRYELPPHPVERPDPARPRRQRRLRQQPRQPGGVRAPLGDPRGPTRRDRRGPLPLALRQVVQLARHPARPAHPGRLHLLQRPHADLRARRRGRQRHRGRQGLRPAVPRAARPRSTRTTGCSPSASPSTRPRSGSSRWSARVRPS